MRLLLTMTTLLMLALPALPLASADDAAPAFRHRSACLVGVSESGDAVNVILLMSWDDRRGEWVGTLDVYFVDAVATGRAPLSYRVQAFEFPLFTREGLESVPTIDIAPDQETDEDASIYLVGWYSRDAPEVFELWGIGGDLGIVALAGTQSVH